MRSRTAGRRLAAKWRGLLLGLTGALFCVAPALAHPHVWIIARSEILYGPGGKLTGLRHAWTFDEGFSAYLSQGLDADRDGKLSREELSQLAKENVDSLVESNYFTIAKAGGKPVEVQPPSDYWMESDGKQLTLRFTIALREPTPGRTVSVEVYDPNFFIAFVLADGDDAVRLKDAPQGCTLSVRRPKSIDPGAQQSLTESFFGSLSASANFGGQFASRALVACP